MEYQLLVWRTDSDPMLFLIWSLETLNSDEGCIKILAFSFICTWKVFANCNREREREHLTGNLFVVLQLYLFHNWETHPCCQMTPTYWWCLSTWECQYAYGKLVLWIVVAQVVSKTIVTTAQDVGLCYCLKPQVQFKVQFICSWYTEVALKKISLLICIDNHCIDNFFYLCLLIIAIKSYTKHVFIMFQNSNVLK